TVRVVHDDAADAAIGVDSVDALDLPAGGVEHLHAPAVAVAGVGEVDAPAGIEGQVVRLVEAVAVVAVGEDGQAPVVLDPGHSAVRGLADHQAPLAVEHQAVRPRPLAVDRGPAVEGAADDCAIPAG